MSGSATSCLTEDELAAVLEHGLTDGSEFEMHVARCSTCRGVLATAAGAASDATERSSPATRFESQAPAVGERVGRYVVGELVGAGAMGTVYVARDPELKRRVALKLLRESADANDAGEDGRRLLREAQAMARLAHPNVATVYEVGRWNGRIFIAMAFVDGGTLRDWCKAPRTWAQILDAFALAGRGLEAAHSAGLIHRDFKPDNVLVTTDGNVYVTDFGLARAMDERVAPTVEADAGSPVVAESTATQTGALIGTPAYMSPEQLDSSAVDARSDVFSFSIALWEALFGARPFQGATLVELRQAIRRGPKEAGPTTVPIAIRDVLRVGLSDDPGDRYPSMNALLDALAVARIVPAKVLDAQPTPSVLGWFVATKPRGRRYAIGTAVIVVAGALAGIVAYRATRDSPAPSPTARARTPTQSIEPLTFNSFEAPVYGVALSPDGALLAYVESRGVFVQGIADRRTRRLDVSPPLKDMWGSVAWFPGGRQLLVGGRDRSGRADLWKVDIATRIATPLGLDDAIAFGAVSPDGTQIAVVEHKGVWAGSLELIAAQGGARTVLHDTRDEEMYSSPRWSPDGRHVAFISGQRTRDSMTYHLDVIDVATRARRTIVRDDDLGQETGHVTFQWAHDGRIVVAMAPSLFKPGRSGLFAIDGREPAFGGSTEFPEMRPVAGFVGAKIIDISFDASGRHMAFVREDVQTDVSAGTLSADGRHLDDVRRLTLSDANERPSDWSLDSRDILVVSDAQNGYGVSALSVESLDSVPIAGAHGRVTWPTTGPAGRGIVYWQIPPTSSGTAFLDLVFLEGDKDEKDVYRTPREVRILGGGRPPPRRWAVRCARSADVCLLAHPSDDDGQAEVVLESVDVDRGTTAPVAHFPGPWQYGFALSPEGKRLAVANPSHESVDIFRSDGSLLRRLAAMGGGFTAATWAADGNGVLATRTDDDITHTIVYLSLDGSATPLWQTNEGVVTNPIASPDGRRVAFTMTRSRSNVWLCSD